MGDIIYCCIVVTSNLLYIIVSNCIRFNYSSFYFVINGVTISPSVLYKTFGPWKAWILRSTFS